MHGKIKEKSGGKCGIIILVPNECLKDSSSGKCRIIMPQPGVEATPHKGLITEIKDRHATVGRLSDIT